jgi:hypothetical protein
MGFILKEKPKTLKNELIKKKPKKCLDKVAFQR